MGDGFVACVVFGDNGNNTIVFVDGELGPRQLTVNQVLEIADEIAANEGDDAPGVIALTQLAAVAVRKGVQS